MCSSISLSSAAAADKEFEITWPPLKVRSFDLLVIYFQWLYHWLSIFSVLTIDLSYFQGVPEQKGDNSCGYFIMRYMRDIVNSKDNMEFATKVRIYK